MNTEILIAKSAVADIERASGRKDDVAAALKELAEIPPEALEARATRQIKTDAPKPWLVVPIAVGHDEIELMVRALDQDEIAQNSGPELSGRAGYLVGGVTVREAAIA